MTNKQRCAWVTQDPLYISYHDHEWGIPIYDDQLLFEFLNLEGMQAGLSWLTILKKRENYRLSFDNFDAAKIVAYNQEKIMELLQYPGIIRNKLKINAIISNATAFLELKHNGQSFCEYLWQFVEGKPIINHWKTARSVPTFTSQSNLLAKDLKRRGFKFVGTTICYAFMQAVGMVNDHTTNCYRHRQI